jgi:hypothetical protein
MTRAIEGEIETRQRQARTSTGGVSQASGLACFSKHFSKEWLFRATLLNSLLRARFSARSLRRSRLFRTDDMAPGV